MNVLKPRQPVPALEVETLNGSWSLAAQSPDNFTLVVFYRGLHCPICSKYVGELDKLAADFAEIGVSILVLSGDDRERAEQARADWGLENLEIGYGLTTEQARDWGLHRSAGRGLTDQHHAVCAPAFPRDHRRPQVRHRKRLPRARRAQLTP
jgi:hypothetical protein